ncbi:BON domain-containing protein [Thiocapsa roseopersicina]|uniref:Hyperosmotically inducible protein n=1 Tax=Thiocapsa roseopersicina TaxID=1058 RepID=A0A1H2RQI7_THIRO|nr:BON domain-containing protein [Thiocapsa roseopersicina]SDW21783.1 hyperosmotically inducible protein [Thiocapsa roseopersicina]
MNRSYNVALMSSVILVFALGSVGCEQEGPAERVGQSIDRTAEQAGDKMEDAKEAASEKAEEAGAYIDDAAITAKIKADFLADPVLEVLQISVTTTDGVVTLSGEVDSQASIDRSLVIAGGVENVQSVRNELVVKVAE